MAVEDTEIIAKEKYSLLAKHNLIEVCILLFIKKLLQFQFFPVAQAETDLSIGNHDDYTQKITLKFGFKPKK